MKEGVVERWSVSVNGYYGVAHIQKDRGWAGWFFLEWLTDHVCHFFHWLPGHWVLCYHCHSPITTWCYNHYTNVGIDVPLGALILAWGSDAPTWWKEQWDMGTEMWREHGAPDPQNGGVVYRTDVASLHSLPRLHEHS